MDTDPSGSPFSNERDFFESLDAEMQDDIVEREQRSFMEAIYQRSLIINQLIDRPDDELLHIALNNTHDGAVKAFKLYMGTLFDVPMTDGMRHVHIKSAFIDTDYSQRALNITIYGDDSGYDADGLSDDISEILEYDDDIAEDEIVQKFKDEFNEDINDFLEFIENEDNRFWFIRERIKNAKNLDNELGSEELIAAVDAFYKTQVERLNAIMAIEISHAEIHDIHQKMIDAFNVCIEVILSVETDPEERVNLVTGLFSTADNTQGEFFSRSDDLNVRSDQDIEKLRLQIETHYKKSSHAKFRSRAVGLFKKEFTNDLNILLNREGRTDH